MWKSKIAPQMPTHGRQKVMKGGDLFAIPSDLRHWNVPIRMQGVPKECNEAEQAKEERGGSFNRQIGPLALGLDA